MTKLFFFLFFIWFIICCACSQNSSSAKSYKAGKIVDNYNFLFTPVVTQSVLTINVAQGLPAGSYNGQITINSGGASNSPQVVPVTLNVTAPPTGTILVTSTPSGAGFQLNGPGLFYYSGNTPATIPTAPAGAYKITWNILLPGFEPPPSEIKALTGGGNISFSGAYISPVLIVPGTMGSALRTKNTQQTVWPPNAFNAWDDSCSSWLLPLKLAPDGVGPALPFSFTCGGFTGPSQGLDLEAYDILRSGSTDFYGGLMADISASGRTVWTFPYDWRKDLLINANLLRQRILQLAPQPDETIDIVAHSQGGLVVRTYLRLYTTDTRIRAIIYLGTPQRGFTNSFAALKPWPGWPILDRRINFDTAALVSHDFPSLYDMLPRYGFFWPNGPNGSLEPFISTYSQLPNQTLVAQSNILWANTIGAANPISHSYAINGSGQLTLRGIFQIGHCPTAEIDPTGDGTGPTVSSAGFAGTQNYYVNDQHSELPNNISVRQAILQLLSGGNPLSISGIQGSPFVATDYTQAYTCSPVTLQTFDSNVNLTGRDLAGILHEDIPKSRFFAFTENEAAIINGSSNTRIALRATDYGTFTLGIEHFQNQALAAAYIFSSVPISIGSIANVQYQPGTAPSLQLDVDGNGTTDFTIVANAPPTPGVVLAVIVNTINRFGLSKGLSTELLATVNSAAKALAAGDTKTVMNLMKALDQKVNAQSEKTLSDKQAFS